MTVKRVELSSTITETADGWEATELYDASVPVSARARWQAATAGGMPRQGDPHPEVPGIFVLRRRFTRLGPDTVRATIQYGVPQQARGAQNVGQFRIRVGLETISEETIYDTDGRLMTTKFAGYIAPNLYSTQTQVHRVSVQRPTFAIQFTVVESASAYRNSRLFSSKTNRTPWQGEPAQAWLMRITSDEQEDGTHRVTYDAVYNPSTWLAELRHTVQGKIPEDVRSNNGVEFRPVYPTADFSRLGLPVLSR